MRNEIEEGSVVMGEGTVGAAAAAAAGSAATPRKTRFLKYDQSSSFVSNPDPGCFRCRITL